MPRKAADMIVLGTGPVAKVLGGILKVPLVGRNMDDTGWGWLGISLAERVKLLLVPDAHAGADRIVRCHIEAWNCPGVSRLGVVMFVPDCETAGYLQQRDVFGRKGVTTSRFCDWSDVIKIQRARSSLRELVRELSVVEFLPIDTWRRQAANASCTPQLLDTIKRGDAPTLVAMMPVLREVHWDSICFPTMRFPNPHHYANAIEAWLSSVTPGVTPNWEEGLALIAPLSTR